MVLRACRLGVAAAFDRVSQRQIPFNVSRPRSLAGRESSQQTRGSQRIRNMRGRRHEGCDVGTTVRLMDHTKNVRRGNVRRSAENLRCASAATPNGLRGLAEAAVLTISLVREEFPRASSTLFAPPHRRRSLKSSHDSRATHAREDAARAVSHTPRFRRDAPRPDRRKKNSWSFGCGSRRLRVRLRGRRARLRALARALPDPARRSAVSRSRLAARAARTAAQCPSPFAPTATCLRAGLPPRSPRDDGEQRTGYHFSLAHGRAPRYRR